MTAAAASGERRDVAMTVSLDPVGATRGLAIATAAEAMAAGSDPETFRSASDRRAPARRRSNSSNWSKSSIGKLSAKSKQQTREAAASAG